MRSCSLSRFRTATLVAFVVATFSLSGGTAFGQEASEMEQAVWTRHEALRQLEFYPHDPFLQFVATQLSKTPQEAAEAKRFLPRPPTQRQTSMRRSQQINLYSIFSASLAVQESLQLDAMTGEAGYDATERAPIPVGQLQGPTVQSHPWKEMLAGRSPSVSRLAACIPDDHLFIRAGSVGKLLQLRQRMDRWYVYGRGQAAGSVRSGGAMDRIQRQWLLETNDALKPIYDAAVAEAAIASSDLFFHEGTDATLMLRLKQPDVVRPTLRGALRTAAGRTTGATVSSGAFLGVDYEHVTTDDRQVHVFAADIGDDLHVRSNSEVAFKRIVRTVLGKPDGREPLRPLAESDEFRYIRTLMPLDAEEEDVLVYLSDPFIRNLIGPAKKLTQKNRLVCRGRLQLLRHAQLLYRTQRGHEAKTIEQLRTADCLGNSEIAMAVKCPNDGAYSLEPSDLGARCSHHGSIDAMTPCCEIPTQRVRPAEREEYGQFVEAYSRYWRTFFDPIAVRVRLEPRNTRVETIVLPLINNSIYSGLAAALGGEPESLESLPVTRSNIGTLAVKLDKERLLRQFGIPTSMNNARDDSKESEAELPGPWSAEQVGGALRQIGVALHHFHDVFRRFPPSHNTGARLDPKSRLSWRVQLLPFIGEQELYAKFRFDEPWDSEHNRSLIDEMPEIYAAGSNELARQGKTRFVFPRDPQALHHDLEQGTRIAGVTDGLSNTISVIVADPEEAVIWTQPQDLEIDMSQPRRGWSEGINGLVNALLADGSVAAVPRNIGDDVVEAYLTRAGNDSLGPRLPRVATRPPPRPAASQSQPGRRPVGPTQLVEELALAEFLQQGVGSQVAIHICDEEPLVDLNVSQLVGLLSTMMARNNRLSLEMTAPAVLALVVNSPVYVSVPVKDPQVVDRTLEKLDRYLARYSAKSWPELGGFLRIEQDSYRFAGISDPAIRAYAFQFGPVKWRFYWMRAGNGLYVASKPGLIGEIRDAVRRAEREETVTKQTDVAPAHAMVRLRPLHWREIKPHFRIGWAESERRACLNNLAPLSHAARSIIRDRNIENRTAGVDGPDSSDQNAPWLDQFRPLAEHLFHGPLACPSHGEYRDDDQRGTVSCTIHGNAVEPKQAPADGRGEIARLPESLRDLRMELTFLEDGLHAVVNIETQAVVSREKR